MSIEQHYNKIYNVDCLEFMKTLPDYSLDLTVTSPPYDNLREYKGFSFDFEGIAKQLFRITKQGGIVVWIVGDETKNFCESLTSFKQAIIFNQIGFNLLDTMIYFKRNYAPAYPSLMRYANQFEYMFVLSKGKPNIFNPKQEIKKEMAEGVKTYRQPDGSLKKKILQANDKTSKDASNVWVYSVSGNKTGHPAVFPIELVKDHILSWSNKEIVIFDPFMGSGTTAVACKQMGRTYIGCEISKEYCDIAQKRLDNLTQSLF